MYNWLELVNITSLTASYITKILIHFIKQDPYVNRIKNKFPFHSMYISKVHCRMRKLKNTKVHIKLLPL